MLVVQSALINLRRHQVHRKLGYALAGLAVLVVVTGLQAVLDATPSRLELGFLNPLDPNSIRGHMLPLYLDLLSLIVFAGAITTAILYRSNRVLHRTTMLIGSMAFMNAAIARLLGDLPIELNFAQFVALTLTLFFAGPMVLLVHDWIKLKRFPTYAFIGACVLLVMVALALYLPGSAWGLQFFLDHLSGWQGVPPI